MCLVSTFLDLPDQWHSGQLKSRREDDAEALETDVEGRGKGSVADPAAGKLTFVSLENLKKLISPKEANSPFVKLYIVANKVLLVDKTLLTLVTEERGRSQ